MTQAELDRAVACATHESVGRIRNMGFTLMVMPPAGTYRPQAASMPAAARSKPQPSSVRRRVI